MGQMFTNGNNQKSCYVEIQIIVYFFNKVQINLKRGRLSCFLQNHGGAFISDREMSLNHIILLLMILVWISGVKCNLQILKYWFPASFSVEHFSPPS